MLLFVCSVCGAVLHMIFQKSDFSVRDKESWANPVCNYSYDSLVTSLKD